MRRFNGALQRPSDLFLPLVRGNTAALFSAKQLDRSRLDERRAHSESRPGRSRRRSNLERSDNSCAGIRDFRNAVSGARSSHSFCVLHWTVRGAVKSRRQRSTGKIPKKFGDVIAERERRESVIGWTAR